jgi:RecA-family ATPase
VLLIVDAAADAFAGEEINRRHVRNFIGLLRSLAIKFDCAILLLAHPSIEGLRSGRGHSGSTHWHNSVRSRFYLAIPPVKDNDEPISPNIRRLTHVKNNRGPRADPITLLWSNGYFVSEKSQVSGDGGTKAQAKAVFLDLLREFNDQGRDVSDAGGRNYAPAIFAKDERAKGITKAGFTSAMNSLFTEKRIRVEASGPPSRQRRRLVEVPAQ